MAMLPPKLCWLSSLLLLILVGEATSSAGAAWNGHRRALLQGGDGELAPPPPPPPSADVVEAIEAIETTETIETIEVEAIDPVQTSDVVTIIVPDFMEAVAATDTAVEECIEVVVRPFDPDGGGCQLKCFLFRISGEDCGGCEETCGLSNQLSQLVSNAEISPPVQPQSEAQSQSQSPDKIDASSSRERFSYKDLGGIASAASSSALVSLMPSRPRPQRGDSQVITSNSNAEEDSNMNGVGNIEFRGRTLQPETTAATNGNIQFTLPNGQVVETTALGLSYEKGFQAGYKAEYTKGYNDAEAGAEPRGPLEIDFCECDTVVEEAQGIAELDELFLPDLDGDSTFGVAFTLQVFEEDADPALLKRFGKGVEEGLKAENGAYSDGYAAYSTGAGPNQNPPFHGETFTYL